MPVDDAVRQATWRNGHLSARLGEPVTACPFAAQSTPEQRVLARIWVTGYLAAAPPPPTGVVDFGGTNKVAVFNPGWRDQLRWPGGQPTGGQWREQPGGGVPDVGITAPQRPEPATGQGARATEPLSPLRTAYELLDLVDRISGADPDDDDFEDERFGYFDDEGEFISDRRRGPSLEQVREVNAELRSAAEDVFAGAFGDLATDVTLVDNVDGMLSVQGRIVDADGNEVGQFERGIYVDGSNNLVARHELLDLAPEVQGSGFASDFNAHLERWYEQSGVRYISLKANIDVGGYAWARAGYEWADPRGYRRVIFRLYGATIARADAAEGHPNRDTAARLRAEAEAGWDLLERAGVPRYEENFDFSSSGRFADDQWDHPDTPTPYEISQVGRPPGGGRDVQWLGKQVLLRSNWEGVRWL